MNYLLSKAKYELDLLKKENEFIPEKIYNDILEVFSKQNHSIFTAWYPINIINKLLREKNLTPLTGEDDEWIEIGDGEFQNKRDTTVFKNKNRFDGKPYTFEKKYFQKIMEKLGLLVRKVQL